MNLAENNAEQAYLLGGYEITATAGAGGMGVVYQGIDTALGRPVAIKVLKDELQAHPAVVARFRREAEAIATLNHPNIVRVYAVGDSGSVPYIVMEFIEGRPLSDILADSGSLPWEEALNIGIQIADALVCAHDAQVIHRDIKPANILIGNDGSVKVTDFGIAKVLNASTQLTVDGARIGTPQYMCPERCKNLPITPSSDIYSLGVMLFQCITGRLPFEASCSAELIGKISAEVPKRIHAYKPDVPESVDRLIAYMLEKNAANRPPDSRALRIAIDRVRRGDNVSEVLPGVNAALDAIRAETPAPNMESETTTIKSTRWRSRLESWWYRIHRGYRILGALALVAALTWGGVKLASGLSPHPANLEERFAIHSDIGRWTERNTLASFARETDSTLTVSIFMDDFALESIAWIGGADGAVALLRGVADTPRAGQTTLLTVNPYLRQVNVSLAPVAEASITLLGTGHGNSDTPGIVLADNRATYFLSTLPGALPESIAPWAAAAATVPASFDAVLLARESGGGNSTLVRMDGRTGQETPLESIQGGTVLRLASHGDSGQIAILSRHETGQRLTIATASHLAESLQVVAEGNISIGARPFSATGGEITYMESDPGQLGTVVVQSVYNREDRRSLGAASAVVWRPGVDELLMVAPDHAGQNQLWRQGTGGNEPRQVSFLDGGIGTCLAASDDGEFALATVPDARKFIMVALSPTLDASEDH